MASPSIRASLFQSTGLHSSKPSSPKSPSDRPVSAGRVAAAVKTSARLRSRMEQSAGQRVVSIPDDDNGKNVVSTAIERLERQVFELRRGWDAERAKSKGLATQLEEFRKHCRSLESQIRRSEQPRYDGSTAQLQNRLQGLNERISKSSTEIVDLKETITLLERERRVFEGTYERVREDVRLRDVELGRLKKRHLDTSQALQAVEADMMAMVGQFDREKAQWVVEMKDLATALVMERRTKDALVRGASDSAIEATRVALPPEDAPPPPQPQMMQRMQSSKGLHLDQTSVDQALERIQTLAGESDIDKAITKLFDSKNASQGLMDYVGEISIDNEKLNARILEMQQEMQEYKTQGGPSYDGVATKKLLELQESMRQEVATRERVSAAHLRQMKTLANIKAGVQQLVQHAGISADELQGGVVTDLNIMEFLALIEQRLVSGQGVSPQKVTFEVDRPSTASLARRLIVEAEEDASSSESEPRAPSDEGDGSDEAEAVITRDQLKRSAAMRLEKELNKEKRRQRGERRK